MGVSHSGSDVAASFGTKLADHVSKEMTAAAEPVLQAALADIERAMRMRLAAVVCAMVETRYTVANDGRQIVITVNLRDLT